MRSEKQATDLLFRTSAHTKTASCSPISSSFQQPSTIMWVIYGISPTAFNVLSELTGRLIEGIVLAALGSAYPFIIWETVKRGAAVPLDSIVAPPQSMGDALIRFRQGGSRWLLFGVFSILAVTTLAHSVANVFLDFITVDLGTNNTFFLSSSPGGVPSYSLLGEQFALVSRFPSVYGLRFLQQTDSIAKGLSRFSILPTEQYVEVPEEELRLGLVSLFRSTLVSSGFTKAKARAFPGDLAVQCQSPTEHTLGDDSIPADATVMELATAGYNDGQNNYSSVQWVRYLNIPDCDYESIVPDKTIEKEPSKRGWEVLDWSLFAVGHAREREIYDYEPFGFRDSHGYLRQWIDFSWDETALAMNRDGEDGREYHFNAPDPPELNYSEWAMTHGNWQRGRRVRDGLTLAIGLDRDGNETHWFKHEQGIEFQVEYSVLSGPGESNPNEHSRNRSDYTLSSWSHSCPIVDMKGNLAVATYPLAPSKASGCIIDSSILCSSQYHPEFLTSEPNTLFAQDNQTQPNGTQYAGDKTPRCKPWALAVTLLSGIEVDEHMLAAYAGIATRNKGINTYKALHNHAEALNSIAAAYVVTRKIVPGKVAVDGVRASIDPGFVCFMLLPLLFLIPLLWMKKKEDPPVPQSIWEVMVFGRDEDIVPHRQDSNSPFPPCPNLVKYGNVGEESTTSNDHLGLGYSFVCMEHPHKEGEMEVDEYPEHGMDPSLTQDSADCDPVDPSGIYEVKDEKTYECYEV